MTESEAKGFVQGKLDCMKKCDIFNKEDKHSKNDCDNCEYCYSKGNFGNQKEAFSMAINALEKQIPKKPISVTSVENSMYVKCPTCKLTTVLYDGCIMEYCKNCGQKLDWSDEE